MRIRQFQDYIRERFYARDSQRGTPATFLWFIEEVGELAGALRHGDRQQKMEEFADVLAWLTTIANVAGVDLAEAVLQKYGDGCPGCGQWVCCCDDAGKP